MTDQRKTWPRSFVALHAVSRDRLIAIHALLGQAIHDGWSCERFRQSLSNGDAK